MIQAPATMRDRTYIIGGSDRTRTGARTALKMAAQFPTNAFRPVIF